MRSDRTSAKRALRHLVRASAAFRAGMLFLAALSLQECTRAVMRPLAPENLVIRMTRPATSAAALEEELLRSLAGKRILHDASMLEIVVIEYHEPKEVYSFSDTGTGEIRQARSNLRMSLLVKVRGTDSNLQKAFVVTAEGSSIREAAEHAGGQVAKILSR